MTELEIADNAAATIRCALSADMDHGFFSTEGRELACLMRDHFERRVAELKACTKGVEETA